MSPVRAALYLDFDNVFGGLLKLDPDAAIQFAQEPGEWLGRLATWVTVGGPRRWLVLRCYMNPAGWVSNPDPKASSERLYFSKFRPYFTRAGFEVIDCPPLAHTKNAADIRLVLDAVDALASDAAYDEFVIASGDSDMTPLLVRLRAADRRTTIVSPSDAADAFTAVADRLIDGEQVLELVQGVQPDPDELDLVPEREVADGLDEVAAAQRTAARDPSFERFRAWVSAQYSAAPGPLHLSQLAQDARLELGPAVDESRWFGYGNFARCLEALGLPHMRLSQHLLWDGSRHQVDGVAASFANGVRLPTPVARLSALLSLPRLPRESWPWVYEVLSEYAGSQEPFSLTEATRQSRDRLTERGVTVNRAAVGFVARGAMYGGAPLYREPPPTAGEVGAAFVSNVLARAAAADISLTEQESGEVRRWLGAPDA